MHNGTARIKSSTSELSQNIQNGISFDIYGAGNDLTTYCPKFHQSKLFEFPNTDKQKIIARKNTYDDTSKVF